MDHYNFFLIQKMSETSYYERNREVILNRAKEYYERNKRIIKRKSKK